MDSFVQEPVSTGRVGFTNRFPGAAPVADVGSDIFAAEKGIFAATAALKMSAHRISTREEERKEVLLLVPIFALPRLRRLLTRCGGTPDAEIVLHLEAPGNSGRRDRQGALLDCFREARDFDHAVFRGINPAAVSSEIATFMMKPFERVHVDEIIDRVSTYQHRAHQQHAYSQIEAARGIYHLGTDCIDLCLLDKSDRNLRT
ncbi:hypothetical protein MMC28_011421 [Mycoblastus sanguinarius]|nr:hypothetical protein [Mycoblastus sanguinarius]